MTISELAEDVLQKQHRVERLINDPTFTTCVITNDQTWVCEFEMLTKELASEWHAENELNYKTGFF